MISMTLEVFSGLKLDATSGASLGANHLVFFTMTEYGIDIIGTPHQNMDVVSHF